MPMATKKMQEKRILDMLLLCFFGTDDNLMIVQRLVRFVSEWQFFYKLDANAHLYLNEDHAPARQAEGVKI